MERNSKKVQIVQNIAIVVLTLLLVTSIVFGATYAWFADIDTSTGTLTMGGGVYVTTLTFDGDDKATNGISITTPTGMGLLPGCRLKMTAGAKIEQTSTPVLLRADISVDVSVSADSTATSEEIASVSTAIYNKIIETLNSTSSNTKWRFYTGDQYFYYIGSNSVAANIGDTVPMEIDASGSEIRVFLFNSTSIDLDGEVAKLLDDNFQNSVVKVELEFQAIQYYFGSVNDYKISTISPIMNSAFNS